MPGPWRPGFLFACDWQSERVCYAGGMTRETVGELVTVGGAVLAGYGVFLWLGLGAALGYAGALLMVIGVMVATTTGKGKAGR